MEIQNISQIAQDAFQLIQQPQTVLSVFTEQNIENEYKSIYVQSIQNHKTPIVKIDTSEEDKKIEKLKKQLEEQERLKEKIRQQKEQNRLEREQDEQKKRDFEKFQKQLREIQRRRQEEDRIIQEKKKKFINPFDQKDSQGVIDALEEDLDYELDQGIDFVKEQEQNLEQAYMKSKQAWQYMLAIKWIFNFFITGVPFVVYCVIAIFYNVSFNVAFNDWWAEGNLFLIGNTIYLLVQAAFSMLLMFEMTIIIRWIKPLRVISLLSAILYNLFYFFTFGNWIWELYFADKSYLDTNSGPIDLLINMLVVYNLILHFPIVPMNLAIILKEIQLQVFQLVGDPKSPDPADRQQLGLIDFEDTFWNAINLLNPFWWIYNIAKIILNYDPKDIVIENKDDEEHYYKNARIFRR